MLWPLKFIRWKEAEATFQVDESGPDAERSMTNEDRCAHESNRQGRHRSIAER
jgi:hypothetical protein